MDEQAATPAPTVPAPPPASPTIMRGLRRAAPKKRRIDLIYALISLLIGTLLWVVIDFKRMVDKRLTIGMELARQLEPGWKIMSPEWPWPAAEVILRGPSQDVDNLRSEEIKLEPDLPTAGVTTDVVDISVSLLAAKVRGLPDGVRLTSVSPEFISVKLARTTTKYVTVEPGNIVGAPQEGYAVGKVHPLDPPAVPVVGYSSFLSTLGSTDVVRTRDFSVEGGRGLVGGMVGLLPLEKDGVRVDVPGMVYMSVELDEIPAQREFETPFEVRALIESPFDRYADLNISPPSVKVTVAGPKAVVDKMRDTDLVIYADIRDRVPTVQGEFNIKCKAITPSRVRVVRIEPDTVKWVIREHGGAAAPPSEGPSWASAGEAAGK